MTEPPYKYRATITAVHDGDTVSADIDCGFKVHLMAAVRLNGVNARELADPGGREARDHLAALCPVGGEVLFRSFGPDKYGGRWIGALTLADGRDVATTMIRDGFAAPWDGRGPKPVPPWPIGAPSA